MRSFSRSRVYAHFLILGLLLSLGASGPASARREVQERDASQRTTAQRRPTIVFMTDFGIGSDAVAICRGVIYGIAEDVRITDISHTVRPYSIIDGARYLAGVTPYYGPGTVFLVVIDPGVGSVRKPLVVKSKRGQYFALPDNGLMTLVAERDGIEGAREITNPAWMIGTRLSSTFHGRDIFSPVAAHLAAGWDWNQVGPELKDPLVRAKLRAAKMDERGLTAEVIALDDPYGNLITNIDADDFVMLGYRLGETVRVKLGKQEIALPYVKTFSDVSKGQPLLYIDSRGHVGLAINQGDFSRSFKIEPPVPLFIPRKPQ
jgi:S-adenosylmethionine hydrolase